MFIFYRIMPPRGMFLARLAEDDLSFPQNSMAQVQAILLLEQGANWSLFTKTGWSPKIGGWVENKGCVYSFALNIGLLSMSDAHKRSELGKGSLRILGLID